jgi:hypothetical protein
MKAEGQLLIDPDVQSVLEFMQEKISGDKLVAVARAVGDIATALWGVHVRTEIQAVPLILLRIHGQQVAATQ